jgi:hypothetical protein
MKKLKKKSLESFVRIACLWAEILTRCSASVTRVRATRARCKMHCALECEDHFSIIDETKGCVGAGLGADPGLRLVLKTFTPEGVLFTIIDRLFTALIINLCARVLMADLPRHVSGPRIYLQVLVCLHK